MAWAPPAPRVGVLRPEQDPHFCMTFGASPQFSRMRPAQWQAGPVEFTEGLT